MSLPIIDSATERLRESRFGREVFGPRIAVPLSQWLQANFVEDNGESGEDPNQGSDSLSPHAETSNQSPAVEVSQGVASDQAASGDNPGDHVEPVDEAIAPTPIDDEPQSVVASVLARAKDLGARVKHHNLVVVAAGIAFWGLLAIPASLFAVVSIAGLVLDPDTVKDQVKSNLSGLPDEVQKIIGDQLAGVSGGSTGGLIAGLVVGLVLALWTASGAMAKLMGALNTIYHTPETRNFAKLRGAALGLTFGGIVFIASAMFLLAALPSLLGSIDGVGDSAATLLTWLRFPVLAVVMAFGLGILYHVGPNRRGKYRPLTAGAIIATVLWILLSALFTVYTATAGSYNETYGSIGGIVVLLLWLFITAFVVLLGAEIHSQTESPVEVETIQPI